MTKIFKVKNKETPNKAADCLNKNGVIIYPTETLYGIGCLAFNSESCKRILEIKNRPENKGMILLVRDKKMLEKYFKIRGKYLKEYINTKKPLTLILESKVDFPAAIVGENKNIAVRISKNPFVKQLFNYIDEPLTSTSANISGKSNSNDFKDIYKGLINKVDLIVDSGSLPPSLGSTILDLTQTPPKVLREGDLTKDELKEFTHG